MKRSGKAKEINQRKEINREGDKEKIINSAKESKRRKIKKVENPRMQSQEEETPKMLEEGNPKKEINKERGKITNPPEVENQRKLRQQEENKEFSLVTIANGWILELPGQEEQTVLMGRRW